MKNLLKPWLINLGIILTIPLALSCTPTPELLQQTSTAAERFGLEPELLMALVWVESRYCSNALSPKGAIGLGQLMPATAKALGVNPHDPQQNLWGAAQYLRQQYDTFEDWSLALAAYNAGPGTVQKHNGIPPFKETRDFVQAVLYVYADLMSR